MEPEAEEKGVESLFDNDDNVQIASEMNQDLGVEDHASDIDMISNEIRSRHSSMSNHHSVPPTTDSDRDIAVPDNEDSEPEANHQSNHRQQSSKQSVCDNFSTFR
jgi:hypothetical protein